MVFRLIFPSVREGPGRARSRRQPASGCPGSRGIDSCCSSVVADELLDAVFELSWQVVVVQQDPVFHRAMISLDLALRHRVVGPAADMSDAVVLEPLAKLARHVGWTVIPQQPWPMQNLDLVQT